MVTTLTFGGWIRKNAAVITIPILSGTIALVVAYGAFKQDNATLVARIAAIESEDRELSLDLAKYDREMTADLKKLDDAIDNLERWMGSELNAIENIITQESRTLERKLTIVEIQVDNLRRRLQLFDGILAPTRPPASLVSPGNEE